MTLPKWLKKPTEPLHLIDYFQVCDALAIAAEALEDICNGYEPHRKRAGDALAQIEALGASPDSSSPIEKGE